MSQKARCCQCADPHGMFELNGTTHVFMQYNPRAIAWGEFKVVGLLCVCADQGLACAVGQLTRACAGNAWVETSIRKQPAYDSTLDTTVMKFRVCIVVALQAIAWGKFRVWGVCACLGAQACAAAGNAPLETSIRQYIVMFGACIVVALPKPAEGKVPGAVDPCEPQCIGSNALQCMQSTHCPVTGKQSTQRQAYLQPWLMGPLASTICCACSLLTAMHTHVSIYTMLPLQLLYLGKGLANPVAALSQTCDIQPVAQSLRSGVLVSDTSHQACRQCTMWSQCRCTLLGSCN